MSLIQEALKRKRKEHNARLSILPDPELVTQQLEEQVQRIKQQALQDIMAEQRSAAGTQPARKSNKMVWGILGIFLVSGVIIGSMVVGGYILTRNADMRTWNQKLLVSAENGGEPGGPAAAGITSPVKATKPLTAPSANISVSERGIPLAVSSPVGGAARADGNNEGAAVGQPAVDPGHTGAWPELLIVGVMAKPNSAKSSAVINNRVVFVNQRIKGVRLIEVDEHGVTLEYRGEKRVVEVGQELGDTAE